MDLAQSLDHELELDSSVTTTGPDRTTGTGTRHREYLVQMATRGCLITKWIDEHFIISGDLIYAFRQRKKQHSRGAASRRS